MQLPLPVISAWDPRATSSDSIDPLGALRAYTSMAEFLLPGVTTITSRVRYLSWVCLGLYLLDEVGGAPTGGTAGRSRRQRLLPWERFLALATAYSAKSTNAAADAPAWRGLRGISYVRRAVEQKQRSTRYELLSNQAGVGGIGTYWVTLVHGGLVDNLSAALTDQGRRLAEAVLQQPIKANDRSRLRGVLADENVAFTEQELERWGTHLSLDVSTASKAEITILHDALLEPPTQRRLSKAIAHAPQARSRHRSFKQLEKGLKQQDDDPASTMAAVMNLARAFESVHAYLLDQFDRLRAAGKQHGPPVSRAIAVHALDLPTELPKLGQRLADCLREATNIPTGIARPVGQFLDSIQPMLGARSTDALLTEICLHHRRVQDGKLDASRQPKLPWLELQGDALIVSPRFALDERPEQRDPDAFTHSYRVESFAGMLTELRGKRGAA
jgi:hypothetical protein